MSSVRCVQAANAIIGEGPSWDPVGQRLLWVDCQRPALFAYCPTGGQTDLWPLPAPVGCALPTTDGRMVLADALGIALLDPKTGALHRITNPEADQPSNYFNDGKVDRAGRLWFGSVDAEFARASGSLYRLDADLSVHRMDTGFICSNGIGWSPDNGTMYFVDSMVRTIFAYDFDLTTGALGDRRTFACLLSDDGFPDGLTVDANGHVWVAIWNGWRVIRYAPDGAIVEDIQIPVKQPTSCMFGGSDLRTLFITSACLNLDRAALRQGPLAGALFAFEPGVTGLSEPCFRIW